MDIHHDTQTPPQTGSVYRFGRFELNPQKRCLLNDGERVRLGSRAISILIALVEQAGQLVSKDRLMSVAWPGMFVEEGALRVHIAAVRRALGDRPDGQGFIDNVMGQGYRFVATVERLAEDAPPMQAGPTGTGPPPRLVGRDDEAELLLKLARAHRLVTIVGPHGVGKSALANVVAPAAARIDGRRFERLDLAGAQDDHGARSLIRQAIATLSEAALLLLDNCEIHLRLAADAVEEAMHAGLSPAFLVTSSEPLRVTGEHVFFLQPLALPARSDLKLREALDYPAVRLLAERVEEGQAGIVLGERDVRPLLEVAARLGGYPLALELAATEARFLGLRGVLARLEGGSRDAVLAEGQEVGPALRFDALLDRHSSELDLVERRMLEKLSVFAGSFALGDAIEVCTDTDLAASEIVTTLTSLVHRSFVTRSRSGATIRYRLPAHLRRHFRAAMLASGDAGALAARHAHWALGQARAAAEDLARLPRQYFSETHGELADDLVEAIEFALLDRTGPDVAAPLILAAAPIVFACNRMLLLRRLASRALQSVAGADPEQCMRLRLLEVVVQEHLSEAVHGRQDDLADPA